MLSSTLSKPTAADRLRRLLDLTATISGLVLLSPLAVAIALAVKWDSPGPVLYRARRVGKAGQPFALYKFRGMARHADWQGPGITGAQDHRARPPRKTTASPASVAGSVAPSSTNCPSSSTCCAAK